jgi:nucleoid-associated protein YgaU
MKTRFRYFTRAGVIVLFVIFTCLGCSGFGQKIEKWQTAVKEKLNFTESESPTEAEKRNSDIYFIHTSRYSWETLGIVADWYTGDSSNWKKLAEINPDVDPPKVAAGSEIFIPVKLLKTRKVLPQDYAGNYCKKCYRHTVRWSGESLSLIARWYTGASGNWRKLAKANPRLNPNRIKKGNVIVISPALLKTREPLPQKVAARYTAGYFAHTVKQNGEKMEVIASWYTGNSANWKVIARANPKLNSNHLVAGNKIYIPSKLLKTRQPIPNSQTAPTVETPKLKPATVEKKMPAIEEEEIKIFGPKQFPKS